jgi:GAF domain-containing protein
MPVHLETKEHGCRSVAAFPLRTGDEAVGMLTIYAADPGHFDDEQVRLLEALAVDLSFVLQAVELEHVREAAGPNHGRR